MSTSALYLDDLQARGRYHFTTAEAQTALGISAVAARAALRRLARHGRVAMPFRGFHVVVPPDYRRLGCLPPEQFVPQLMGVLGLPYYVGLLSAAQYHGAAHHRPQAFQVVVGKNRPAIECGSVRVDFIARKEVGSVPTTTLNTPRGPLIVATVESTAVDIVGYPYRVGGLDQVVTVLSELAPAINADRLLESAKTAPLSWSQRLGYLLDQLGAEDRTEPLAAYVHQHAAERVLLAPAGTAEVIERSARWRLDANEHVEAEE